MKTLARFKTLTVAVRNAPLLLSGLLAVSASAQVSQLGPPSELSRPNAVGTCDDGISLPGPWPLGDTVEPYVAVNPVNPQNIVAAWIQNCFQNIVAAVSFDGGRTWQKSLVPFSICSGGTFAATGDPWLSFTPQGELYLSSISGTSFDYRGLTITKCTDGGLHWSPPALVYGQTDDYTLADKPSITADPKDPHFAYAVFDVSDTIDGTNDHTFFARTTDGGQTWEPARSIYTPGGYNLHTDDQILVLPNGTLVCMFEQMNNDPVTGNQTLSVSLIRSADRGQTWSGRIDVSPELWVPVFDPENGVNIFADGHSFAVDPRNGNLYAVWEDARFSNFQCTSIAFSMSTDGGLTWSAPIAINQTPQQIPAANQQAFLPSIAVAANGTIGVAYYDCRFNDPSPGLPTDRWLVTCHPTASRPATNPANWSGELRLTARSFDMEQTCAPFFIYDVGDYEGLANAGIGFLAVFAAVDEDNITSIFFRQAGALQNSQ